MERYYLAFDAGTQSVKVAVYDAAMACVAQSSAMTPIRYPGPGMVEMSADDYLSLAVNGIRACADQMAAEGRDPRAIRAIMGDGIICGIVGVDARGDAVTPYVNYLDSRTQPDADRVNADGLAIWARETGNAEASCMFPAMFARWFLRNSEAFRERGAKFVHNAPYILMHLAGLSAEDAFVDQGAMSGWGLGYDVAGKEWSDAQLEILGIDRRYLPRILKPWDVVGGLTPEMAEATGLRAGTPVCAGAGDTMQSLLGCGAFGPGCAVDVAGTCAMFCMCTDGVNDRLSSAGSDLIFNSGTLDGTYFYWGFIRTGGLSLRWFKDTVCKGLVDYGLLTSIAETVPAGCNGVTFLPYLTGGYGDMSQASGAFLNLTPEVDAGVMWRSVLEAIGYDYMGVTDRYRAAGLALDRVTITEGGSSNDLWNQIKADMLGVPAVTMRDHGGALLTDCITAAYAVGDVPDIGSALKAAETAEHVYEPDLGDTAVYRRQYEGRRAVLDGMRGVFPSLRSMVR